MYYNNCGKRGLQISPLTLWIIYRPGEPIPSQLYYDTSIKTY